MWLCPWFTSFVIFVWFWLMHHLFNKTFQVKLFICTVTYQSWLIVQCRARKADPLTIYPININMVGSVSRLTTAVHSLGIRAITSGSSVGRGAVGKFGGGSVGVGVSWLSQLMGWGDNSSASQAHCQANCSHGECYNGTCFCEVSTMDVCPFSIALLTTFPFNCKHSLLKIDWLNS